MASDSNFHEKKDIILDREELKRISDEVSQFSASLAERAIINNIEESIHTKLMFLKEDLRKILLYSMKNYRKKTEIPVQKLSLLDRDQRDQSILILKNNILETSTSLFKRKREDLIKYVDSALDEFFEPYLEF